MSASQRACRKLMEWLTFCRSIGWDASAIPRLTDLWWQYHDEQTGELIQFTTSRPMPQQEET